MTTTRTISQVTFAVRRNEKLIRRVRSEAYARRLAREQSGVSGYCTVEREAWPFGQRPTPETTTVYRVTRSY